ncbi:MAG: hypothetical protein AAB967_02135, partial [Patescibacteria group bacterium]
PDGQGSASGGDSLMIIKDLGLNILRTAGQFNFLGDGNWRHNIAGEPLLSFPIGVLLLVGVIMGFVGLFKIPNYKLQITNNDQVTNDPKSKRSRIWDLFCAWNLGFKFLIAWLIIAAAPVVVSNEGIPHALRSILMIPPVMILVGLGAHIFFRLIFNLFRRNSVISAGFFVTIIIMVTIQAYTDYFVRWGKNREVRWAFSANYVAIGKEINTLPRETPKYVIVEASGTNVRGIPMPAQTVMFITDSFREESRRQKNIRYILPEESQKIPAGSSVFVIR